MKKKSYLLFYTLYIVLQACSSHTDSHEITIDRFSNNLDTSYVFCCTLEENQGYLGKTIQTMKFISDSTFIISDRDNVFIYHLNGNQLAKIADKGRGGEEYLSADKIYVSDKYIYIWCGQTLKLNQYSHNGKFIAAYTGFKKAIKNLEIKEDRYVYFYQVYTPERDIIRVYDLHEAKFLNSVGYFTNEDVILLLSAGVRPLSVVGDYAYFSNPGELAIHQYSQMQLSTYKIKDGDFVYKEVEDAEKMINYHFEDAFNVLCNASVVNEVIVQDQTIYLFAETGIIKKENARLNFLERFYKIYTLDTGFNPISITKLSYNPQIVSTCIYSGNFYVVVIDDSGKYVLKKIKI